MRYRANLIKALNDFDDATQRLVKATAPNSCLDCSEPCGYVDQYCPMCLVRHERQERRMPMLRNRLGVFDLIDDGEYAKMQRNNRLAKELAATDSDLTNEDDLRPGQA